MHKILFTSLSVIVAICCGNTSAFAFCYHTNNYNSCGVYIVDMTPNMTDPNTCMVHTDILWSDMSVDHFYLGVNLDCLQALLPAAE